MRIKRDIGVDVPLQGLLGEQTVAELASRLAETLASGHGGGGAIETKAPVEA